MDPLNFEPTKKTPKVFFDENKKVLEFFGTSIAEDAAEFYQPILDWLNKFEANPLADTKFEFKLDYFNTASSKLILDIILKLDEINTDKLNLVIIWYYEEDDEDMEEAGRELEELVEMDFKLVSY